MDWDIVIGVLTMVGVFVLALQKQRVERPLVEAQTSAATMTSINGQVTALVAARGEQDLIIARQNTQLADMRTTIETSKYAHERELAALRAETEAKLAAQAASWQQQLTDANTTIGTLTKRITDLEALLKDSRKETAEAKEESADKTDPIKSPEPTVPLPFPVTIVPGATPPPEEEKSP